MRELQSEVWDHMSSVLSCCYKNTAAGGCVILEISVMVLCAFILHNFQDYSYRQLTHSFHVSFREGSGFVLILITQEATLET